MKIMKYSLLEKLGVILIFVSTFDGGAFTTRAEEQKFHENGRDSEVAHSQADCRENMADVLATRSNQHYCCSEQFQNEQSDCENAAIDASYKSAGDSRSEQSKMNSQVRSNETFNSFWNRVKSMKDTLSAVKKTEISRVFCSTGERPKPAPCPVPKRPNPYDPFSCENEKNDTGCGTERRLPPKHGGPKFGEHQHRKQMPFSLISLTDLTAQANKTEQAKPGSAVTAGSANLSKDKIQSEMNTKQAQGNATTQSTLETIKIINKLTEKLISNNKQTNKNNSTKLNK